MREIKFRAWDTTKKKMHHEISLMFANDLNGVFEGLNECGCIVMQYTGLKDKNGKEIYEGDIFKSRNQLHLVEYKDEYLGFGSSTKIKGQYTSFPLLSNFHVLEVIGNIYENPQLLKEEI